MVRGDKRMRAEKRWYPDEKIRARVKEISAKDVSSMLLDFTGDAPVKFDDPGLIELFLNALHNAVTGEPILLLPAIHSSFM